MSKPSNNLRSKSPINIGPDPESYIVIDGKIAAYITQVDMNLEYDGTIEYSVIGLGDPNHRNEESPIKELQRKLLAAESVIERNKLVKEYKKDCKVLEVADNL